MHQCSQVINCFIALPSVRKMAAAWSCVMLCGTLGAQDSLRTVLLDSATITASRGNSFSEGQLVTKLSARPLEANLSDLLAREGHFFVKGYGLGSIATSSMRGLGASQTAVLWNGINLNSSMLGLSDLSLLFGSASDDVYLQEGGGSALFGSGAVGGAIRMESKPQYSKGWSGGAHLSYGSFTDARVAAEVGFGGSKLSVRLRGNAQQADNDFSFVNTTQPDAPLQRQPNAAVRNISLASDIFWRITPKQQLAIHAWYLGSARQVPPNMNVPKSLENQEDQSLRLIAKWQWLLGSKLHWLSKAAWLTDVIDYRNPNIGLRTLSTAQTRLAETELQWQLHPSLLLNVGAQVTQLWAEVPNYRRSPGQLRHALFASLKTSHGRLSLAANVRAEWMDGRWQALSPSLGTTWRHSSSLSFRAQASRSYRLPTFNDLYWLDGFAKGNPALQPEQGWSGEVGTDWVSGKMAVAGTVFSHWLEDYILWQPDGRGVWTPENEGLVWARGAKVTASRHFDFTNPKIQLLVKANYSFTQSTRLRARYAQEEGQQMVYVPLHQGGLSFSLSYRSLELLYQHQLVSERFTTASGSQYLPHYHIGYLSLSGKLIYCKHNKQKPLAFRYFMRLNNLWNTRYQVIESRAMPGLNAQVGLGFTL